MQPSTPSDPEQFMVAAAGEQVACSVEGSGDAVLVMVPGLPGRSRDFRWLAPALSDVARVVRFDPPGFGRSPRSAWQAMTARRKAEVLLDLAASLGLPPFVLVGHSFGSVVAAEAAALQPRAVSHLVLLSSPGVHAHFPVPLVRAASIALRTDVGRKVLAAPQRIAYRAGGFPSSLSDEELAFTSLDSGVADFRGYRKALAAAPQPTLIAWAMDDRQVPPRNSAALHEHPRPGPRVAFASGGHNIQKTRAIELADMIMAFARQRP